MNIGIYGDSYADPHSLKHVNKNPKGRSWVSILENSIEHNIVNYAKSGSSFYYSYNIFKKTRSLYDKTIFVGTLPGRIYAPTHPPYHFTHNHANTVVANNIPEKYNRKALEDYYMYFYNDEEAKEMRMLMKEQILTDPNVLYIDVWNDNGISLGDINLLDFKGYFTHQINSFLINDNRYNHLNNENNVILSNKILKWIDTGVFSLDIADFVETSKEDFRFYFDV